MASIKKTKCPISIVIEGAHLNLEPDLDDLERVGEDHLATSGHTTGDNLSRQSNLVRFLVFEGVPHQVIDSEFDGFFWGNSDQLRSKASVEPFEALVLEHLAEAVPRVLVQDLTNNLPLILHAGFHQVNRVDERSTNGSGN